MKRALLLMLSLTMPMQAQTAADWNEGLQVSAGAQAGEYSVSWWGKAGRTYFIQQSFDMMTWTYAPVVMSGEDDVCGLNIACGEFRQFWRLRHTDQTYTGTAGEADFDDDGLTNADELVAGTDPFNLDSDGDGFYDGQELANESDPLNAGSVPNENLTEREDDTRIEQPVALFEQRKSVSDDWYSGYAAPSSYVSWLDYTGNQGYQSYQWPPSRWDGKLQALVYPALGTNPYTYYASGHYRAAFAELRQHVSGGVGGDVVGEAAIEHHRVGLYSEPNQPGQPWYVSRNYFTYRKTLPHPDPGVAPLYSNLDVVALVIPPGTTHTPAGSPPAADGCWHLNPPPTMSQSIQDFIGRVTATPVTEFLALDNTGPDHWLTLQEGGSGVDLWLEADNGFVDNIAYKTVGDGVQPVTSPGQGDLPWGYVETFSGTTAGDGTSLHVALEDEAGNAHISSRPLLSFDVKEPKELYITLRPIGRGTGANAVSPASPPTATALKAYLDSVFVPQVNVHTHVTIMPQVNVDFDHADKAGLKQSFGGNNRGTAGRLDIMQGSFTNDRKVSNSDEEDAILAAAPADSSAAITLYWVACDGMDAYSWQDPTSEDTGNPNLLQRMPLLGWAGKGMESFRTGENDTRPRVIWLVGGSAAYYQANFSTQEFIIAHELGHVLGNLSHTIERYDGTVPGSTQPGAIGPWSGFSLYSDNNRRLMTGMAGPKRANGPKLLNKLERDKISLFKDYGSQTQ